MPAVDVVYVSCSKGSAIEILALNRTTGALWRIDTVALPGNGMPLTIARDRRHLYAAVADRGEGEGPGYVTFAIDQATGRLTPRAMIDAPGRMSHIWIERTGRYLLGASVANDLIVSSAISPDGMILAPPIQIASVTSKAHHITTDAGNRVAYVPNLGADIVELFAFDVRTGQLSDQPLTYVAVPKGAAPRHIAHHPGGRWAYLLCEESDRIAAFEIAADGSLIPDQTTRYTPEGFAGKAWGAQILVTPDGRHLYASDRATDTIAHFAIDAATGRLGQGASTATETGPRNFAITPSGNHLIAAGETSNRLACYTIDRVSGRLDHVATLATAAGPVWIDVLEGS